MADIRISCHCGAWQARLTAPPRTLDNCHCGFCRQLSGAAFSTWAQVGADHLVVERAGELRRYQASENCARFFCPTCGTHVRTEDGRMPGKVGLPAGIIMGASLPPVAAHYFFDDRAPWSTIDDGAPRFGGESGVDPIGI